MTETAGCACERGLRPLSPNRPCPPYILAIQAESMNIQDTASARSAYAIGEPVKRKEDATLLRGQGRYTDDINLPNQVYAYILRSTIAHGRIKSINTEAARKMKGVLAVYTGEDLKGYGTIQSALPFKSRDGSDMKKPGRAMLPTDKVRFVGDPI